MSRTMTDEAIVEDRSRNMARNRTAYNTIMDRHINEILRQHFSGAPLRAEDLSGITTYLKG